jgi:amino acid transporter
VDTVLLVSSGFATHNIIAPALRITDERTRLRLNRWGVLVLGVVSWLIAMRGARIGELVEEASAFGSAGIVVVGCFGLFTRFGGATAALITLVAGAASYVGGVYGGLPYPFLTSLAVAVACYVGVAVARRKGGS